jgi:3-hydroxyisobutyrate dehydrogenase
MLADDVSSEAVDNRPDGIFKADTAAPSVIDMGKIGPQNIDALMQSAHPDMTVVDAPISGATQAARDAQLLMMAGCTRAAGAPLMPPFDTMGRHTVFLDHADLVFRALGPPGRIRQHDQASGRRVA